MFKDPLQRKLKQMEKQVPSKTYYKVSPQDKVYFAKRWFWGSAESIETIDRMNPTGERELKKFMNSSNRSHKEPNYDYNALTETIKLFAKNNDESGLRRLVDFIKAEIVDLESHAKYYLEQRKIVGLHFVQARDNLIEVLYSELNGTGYLDSVHKFGSTFDSFDDVKRLKAELDAREEKCKEKRNPYRELLNRLHG